MAALKKTRASQAVQASIFEWNFDDTMADVSGVATDFGLTTITAAHVYKVMTLPKGARVVGGTLERIVAFDTAGYTLMVGDSGDDNRYLASADLKAAGESQLLTLWGSGTQDVDIRLSVTNVDVCSTGKARLTVLFTIDDRAAEVTGKM
jgi:hypothetical protein